MGKRTLQVRPELLVGILKGLGENKPQYFDVIAEPIPDDVKIVYIAAYTWPDEMFVIDLESAKWPANSEGYINPKIRVVEARK